MPRILTVAECAGHQNRIAIRKGVERGLADEFLCNNLDSLFSYFLSLFPSFLSLFLLPPSMSSPPLPLSPTFICRVSSDAIALLFNDELLHTPSSVVDVRLQAIPIYTK